jgi:hypothetical protein
MGTVIVGSKPIRPGYVAILTVSALLLVTFCADAHGAPAAAGTRAAALASEAPPPPPPRAVSAPSRLAADNIYRSVDEHGRVTYSQHPPDDPAQVEQVDVRSDPSAERQREARARARALREAAQQLERAHAREQAHQTSEIEAAQAALSTAEKRLEQARIMRDEDWQGLAGGGRRLRESYHHRVEAAQAQVEAARERLRQAQH